MDDFTRENGPLNEPELHWGSTPSQASTHLLIALFPDRAVQRAIEEHRKDWIWPQAHYFPRSSRLHLTLHCFADQPASVETRLREALATVPMRQLSLVLASSRPWKNDISVVQPAEHEGLRTLREDIVRAVAQAGIVTRPEKFTPHITIARKTTGALYPRHLPPIQWAVKSFQLVRSCTSHPVHHEVLASYGPNEGDGV